MTRQRNRGIGPDASLRQHMAASITAVRGIRVGHWTDLEMLLSQAGRDRTSAEYRALLERAGFRVTRVVPTASPLTLVEAEVI